MVSLLNEKSGLVVSIRLFDNRMSMKSQEIFNVVVEHLRKQNNRSMYNEYGNVCAYYGINGGRCPVGLFIRDEEYDSGYEFKSIRTLMSEGKISKQLRARLESHVELLQQLQEMHDREDPSCWEDELKRIAVRFQLHYNPPVSSHS